MGVIRAYGISVDVRKGWEARIYRRPGDPSPQSSAAARDIQDGGELRPVLHLANFALPAERGDFGSGAVERMKGDDVLVCILEFGPVPEGGGLYRHEGIPLFRPGAFSASAMQRSVAGLCGAQSFFRVGRRAFSAYTVIAGCKAKTTATVEVNKALSWISIEAA